MSEKNEKQDNPYSLYYAIDGHDGYYQNPISQRIKYSKTHYVKSGSEQVPLPVVIFTKTTLITEAKRVVDEQLIERFSQNPAVDKAKKLGILNPTLKYCWDEELEERSLTRHENTMQGYRVSWNYGISGFWGNKTAIEITPENMKKYTKWYLSTNPERIFFNTGKHLQMLFSAMKRRGYIENFPAIPDLDTLIKNKTQREEVGRVYTDSEFKALLENAFNERVRVGILCYRYMGMRLNELLRSERSKWDFKNKTAKLWSYKNKKWRTIPIPEPVIKPLQAFIKNSAESKFLFPAPTNPDKFMASQVFDEQWTKTKVAAKIRDATVPNAARIHDIRHTFATQTAVDGWPPIVACYVLDMSLKEYQQTYTHVTEGDINRLMAKSFGGLK